MQNDLDQGDKGGLAKSQPISKNITNSQPKSRRVVPLKNASASFSVQVPKIETEVLTPKAIRETLTTVHETIDRAERASADARLELVPSFVAMRSAQSPKRIEAYYEQGIQEVIGAVVDGFQPLTSANAETLGIDITSLFDDVCSIEVGI